MSKTSAGSTEQNSNRVFISMIISASIMVFAVLWIYIMTFKDSQKSSNPEAWGQFGDYLGGTLNPALSFLALIAVLLTFRLQEKELRNSTIEMTKSSEALQEQVKSSRKLNFENTFFNLLRLHQEIIQSTLAKKYQDDGNASGRNALLHLYHTFQGIYSKNLHSGSGVYENINEDSIQNTWSKFMEQHQHVVGHYFRNLYTIVKFIDDAEVEEKSTYIRILRAQLSSPELALLFFNCLHPVGLRFKALVEKYGILENMERSMIPYFDRHEFMYKSSAYHLM